MATRGAACPGGTRRARRYPRTDERPSADIGDRLTALEPASGNPRPLDGTAALQNIRLASSSRYPTEAQEYVGQFPASLITEHKQRLEDATSNPGAPRVSLTREGELHDIASISEKSHSGPAFVRFDREQGTVLP